MDIAYLQLLAEQYPSVQAASTQIIELEATLELPKGTEHFLSDIHGEYEAFSHLLRNSSGSLRRRIDEMYGNELTAGERRALATLVYYPEQKLPLALEKAADEQLDLCKVESELLGFDHAMIGAKLAENWD